MNLETLNDREKEVLRLLGQGFDAKSSASELGISLHAVNERLRSARRKLGVTSSREAARSLIAAEPSAPKFLGHKNIGVAGDAAVRRDSGSRYMLFAGGLFAMSLIILAASASLMFASDREGPLPNWTVVPSAPSTSEARNEVRLEGNRLLWNGSEVSEKQVGVYLDVVREMNPQPPTILSRGAGIPEPRLQRVRNLIDDALQCRPATCVEISSPKPR